MGILSKSPSLPQEHGGSAPVYQPCGSGSRPTKSVYETPTSAPTEPKTLGRDPGGSLK